MRRCVLTHTSWKVGSRTAGCCGNSGVDLHNATGGRDEVEVTIRASDPESKAWNVKNMNSQIQSD